MPVGLADALPARKQATAAVAAMRKRSEEHTSELQSQSNLVCRLLLEKKKIFHKTNSPSIILQSIQGESSIIQPAMIINADINHIDAPPAPATVTTGQTIVMYPPTLDI